MILAVGVGSIAAQAIFLTISIGRPWKLWEVATGAMAELFDMSRDKNHSL